MLPGLPMVDAPKLRPPVMSEILIEAPEGAATAEAPAPKTRAKKAAAKKAPAKKAATAKKTAAKKSARTKAAPVSEVPPLEPVEIPAAPPTVAEPLPAEPPAPSNTENRPKIKRLTKSASKPEVPEEPAAADPAPPAPPSPKLESTEQPTPEAPRSEAQTAGAKSLLTLRKRDRGPRPNGNSPAPSAETPPPAQPPPAAEGAPVEGVAAETTTTAEEAPATGQVSQNGERPDKFRKPWQKEKFNKFQKPDRQTESVTGPVEQTAGLLEISGKGFGFIRLREKNYVQSPTDTFVTPEMVRRYGLRDGVWLEGEYRRGHRGPQLTELAKVNGRPPDQYRQLPMFEELTAINPTKRFVLETEGNRFTTRLVDMIAPIGRGQRGLIVAAPRAGKTTFLEHIAQSILRNYETTKLIVLLVDERPEEVTELTRALQGAEIMASSNDQDARAHIRMAELAIERAKRLVEAGEHVFMLLDSITRLARAFNQAIRGGGKAMSGGIDSRALEMPRKIFAAARNTREAGSLTIVATALIETNNKGDDLIFQEFKGTGNMELVLDRKIAQQYIYPAIDIFKSGTRREELLLPPYQLEKINVIRRGLAGHKPVEAVERLIHFLERFPSNAELLTNIATPKG